MQTEDQLTRDMLAATASFINCVGGVDGRFVAVKKSWVINLEPEVVSNQPATRAKQDKTVQADRLSPETP